MVKGVRSARPHCVLALALLVSALAVAAAPLRAQGTFTGSTNAVAVEVPVQVVADGEPVRGLKATDFELYDGRKKVAITGFDVLDLDVTKGVGADLSLPASARRHFL